MVMHLRYRRDARSSVLERVLDVLRLRVAALHAQQSDDGCQAVLDAMAHLARQHGLVFEGIAKLGVRLLPLDGDAEQSGETRKEIRIGKVELTRVRAVDFEYAERQMAFAASRDQDVNSPFDAMVRQ